MNVLAADLFCGAGGTSEGMRRAAARLGLTLCLSAVNHWPLAEQLCAAILTDVMKLKGRVARG